MSCNGKNCTEYTGDIPSGYTSLDEWAMNANVRAYTVIDGQLILDTVRLAELENAEVIEAEENRIVTAKELYNVLSISSETSKEEFTAIKSGGNVIVLEDAGEYTIPNFSFRCKGGKWGDIASLTWGDVAEKTWLELAKGTADIEVVSSTLNILPMTILTPYTENGLSITPNEDRSLTISGMATAETQIVLSGTDISTDALFIFDKDTQYVKSGLESLTLALYSYDGTDRVMLSSGGNGTLQFDELTKVTEAVLTVPNGTTLNNVKISPQIEIGSTATEYVTNKRSYMRISCDIYSGDKIEYDSGKVTRNGSLVCYANELKTYGANSVFMVDAGGYDASVMYYLPSILEQIKTMKITADRLILEGYTSINNGFTIDEKGDAHIMDGSLDLATEKVFLKSDYSQADLDRLTNILLGVVTPTDADYEKLDLECDGSLSIGDIIRIRDLINGVYGDRMTLVTNISLDPETHNIMKVYTETKNASGTVVSTNTPMEIKQGGASFNGHKETLTNYVVDEGISSISGNNNGVMRWRKWANGDAECWGTIVQTLTSYATAGGFNGYYININYPITFTNTPFPTFTPKVGSGFSMNAGVLNRTNSGCNLYCLATASGEQATEWSIDVKGTWK